MQLDRKDRLDNLEAPAILEIKEQQEFLEIQDRKETLEHRDQPVLQVQREIPDQAVCREAQVAQDCPVQPAHLDLLERRVLLALKVTVVVRGPMEFKVLQDSRELREVLVFLGYQASLVLLVSQAPPVFKVAREQRVRMV